jgi:hypothetical protein
MTMLCRYCKYSPVPSLPIRKVNANIPQSAHLSAPLDAEHFLTINENSTILHAKGSSRDGNSEDRSDEVVRP